MFGKTYIMKSETKEKISKINKGRTYYSSPDLNHVKAIKSGELPPEGWIKGNATKFKEKRRKEILLNNSKEN